MNCVVREGTDILGLGALSKVAKTFLSWVPSRSPLLLASLFSWSVRGLDMEPSTGPLQGGVSKNGFAIDINELRMSGVFRDNGVPEEGQVSPISWTCRRATSILRFFILERNQRNF